MHVCIHMRSTIQSVHFRSLRSDAGWYHVMYSTPAHMIRVESVPIRKRRNIRAQLPRSYIRMRVRLFGQTYAFAHLCSGVPENCIFDVR